MAQKVVTASTTAPTGVHPRELRWSSQGFADITKLREIAAKHQALATKSQQRAAKLQTRIEKLRHSGTVLREKAERALQPIAELEQRMAQNDRDIKAATQRSPGPTIGSDVTGLHYKNRKLQQKVVDLQHKARTYEHKAAQKVQKAAELKIKVDRYLEESKVEEQEAQSYLKRADRLQLATEADLGASHAPTPETSVAPENPPGPA